MLCRCVLILCSVEEDGDVGPSVRERRRQGLKPGDTGFDSAAAHRALAARALGHRGRRGAGAGVGAGTSGGGGGGGGGTTAKKLLGRMAMSSGALRRRVLAVMVSVCVWLCVCGSLNFALARSSQTLLTQEYHRNPFWNLVGLGAVSGKNAKKISKVALIAIIGDVLDRKIELCSSGDEVRACCGGRFLTTVAVGWLDNAAHARV